MNMIQCRGLTNQIQYVLLSMDLPYQVTNSYGLNSVTAALFYGFKPDGAAMIPGFPPSCNLPAVSSNSYAYSELSFASAPPNAATTNSFLAVMLTDTNLQAAEMTLDHGVAGDSTFPAQTVYLEKTDDPVRNMRFLQFDNVIFDTLIQGSDSLESIDTDFTGFTNIFGFETGLPNYSLSPDAFVPGGIGDSLTSFGGMLFVDSGQTSLLSFLEAGASGSYGTVCEPCNYFEKFPNPLDYFYQMRGFSLAEVYYQSVENPYQGLIVGEPLSAPFARRGAAYSSQLQTNDVLLSGQTNLEVQFTAAITNLPLAEVDLFVDGIWFETITNIQPSNGDQFAITLNGVPINYTVSSNASIASVAKELVTAINSFSNATSVAASLSGTRLKEVERDDNGYSPMYSSGNSSSDRVELHLLKPSIDAQNVTLDIAAVSQLTTPTTFLISPRPDFLESEATGYHYFFVTNAPFVGDWLQLKVQKTNGSVVTISVTNTISGATGDDLVSNLLKQIAATPALQSPDGIYGTFANGWDDPPDADFFILAQSSGWLASQIQVSLNSSSHLKVMPSGPSLLQDNISDLQGRNFFYVTSGDTSLPINFSLDTTQLADGFHELTFVAYEGSSVRTQTHFSRRVQVQNTPLQAAFTILYGATNTDLSATLSFSVVANTSNISSIKLFGTGGDLGSVSNQPSTQLSVSAAFLGLGLHPFYAIVTGNDGSQYRTQTIWIRVIGPEPPFSISASASPLIISWTATAGRSYDLLTATNLAGPFQVIATLVPSNSITSWSTTNDSSLQTYYRVRTSN